ncbi:hypothetical protein BH09VER1_BH09VER1_34720 [soil metagenome]
MKNSLSSSIATLLAVVGTSALALQASAATYNFTNGGGDNAYLNSANWSGTVVPNTASGDTAVINNGSAVNYVAGPDLTLSNGGQLQVTNGSFTQTVGPAYIQLAGTGSILVNGGTFNQGTASSNPFNVTGTGNAFTVSSGVANISSSFNMNTGLTYLQSGGVVNVAGAETDFNTTTNTLAGGTFNTKLITGVNAPGASRFDITGGVLNLTGAAYNGIYAGGLTQYINFTLGSTGVINWTSGSTTITDVQNFVTGGIIEYNSGGYGNLSDFNITSNAGVVSLSLVVPEPSTYACLLGGLGACVVLYRRRRLR